ncbi:MAG: MBL fold metallo-hydrolase [Synergistaceae bacterium]|nr:MBL fold metallo-hydrolase [Synergistaceae bacterium]MBQ7666342.1 MBL fold metallo-hydrolase [Synergistaceae bacterium]
MKLIMLGTGNALVTECYNTCFILSHEGKNILIDGGGGSTILRQIKHAGFSLTDIHDIFITHTHIDHILGIIWVIRIIAQLMNRNFYSGDVNIYSHDEVIAMLYDLTNKLLLPYQTAYIDQRIHMNIINDGEIRTIAGHEIKFFDVKSERTKQYGFTFTNHKLTFCGDEPCHESCECYVSGSDWLIHEAFCLHSQAEHFRPYEKHHSTVKDACELAERLNVRNIILCHTEDENIHRRKELYTLEGRQYFNGNIYIPDDLEAITLY